jgi:hypothetical protein
MRSLELLRDDLAKHPYQTIIGIFLEYAGFVAACLFVAVLWVTRLPLRYLDETLGLSIRRRAIEVVAKLSPG